MIYENYDLGKTTEIIAKIVKILCVILVVFVSIVTVKTPENYLVNGILVQGEPNVANAVLCTLIGCWLLKILFNPIIKLHENTILFANHKIGKNLYEKERKKSSRASFFLSFTVIGIFITVLTQIFLSKTKFLLQQGGDFVVQEELVKEKKNNLISNKILKIIFIIFFTVSAYMLFFEILEAVNTGYGYVEEIRAGILIGLLFLIGIILLSRIIKLNSQLEDTKNMVVYKENLISTIIFSILAIPTIVVVLAMIPQYMLLSRIKKEMDQSDHEITNRSDEND